MNKYKLLFVSLIICLLFIEYKKNYFIEIYFWFNKMNYNKRLKFYLGTDKDIQHTKMNEHCINDLTFKINTHDEVYDQPLKNLLIKTDNINERFSFARGDVISNRDQNNWTLSKNRCEGNTSAILLKLFNKKRHWDLYYNKPEDIPFDKKKNIVFWRGVTTGSSQEFDAKIWKPRKVNRFNLVEKWFNKKKKLMLDLVLYIEIG